MLHSFHLLLQINYYEKKRKKLLAYNFQHYLTFCISFFLLFTYSFNNKKRNENI